MDCFLSLGSNMGKRKENIERAIRMLDKSSDISLLSISRIYESKAMYNTQMDNFYNGVVRIKTSLSPDHLLRYTKDIENQLGRKRSKKRYSPRTIDIDILCYGDKIIHSEELTIPHPHIKERKFVLKPWSDIDSDYIIANENRKIKELLDTTTDKSTLKKIYA